MGVKKLFEEKRDWRAYQSRVKSLPKDYLIVYNEIEKYLFKVCCVEGRDAYSVLPGILELFEEGAAMGKSVLAITGPDVAAFCDNLLV